MSLNNEVRGMERMDKLFEVAQTRARKNGIPKGTQPEPRSKMIEAHPTVPIVIKNAHGLVTKGLIDPNVLETVDELVARAHLDFLPEDKIPNKP